jgi:hypothetical protein
VHILDRNEVGTNNPGISEDSGIVIGVQLISVQYGVVSPHLAHRLSTVFDGERSTGKGNGKIPGIRIIQNNIGRTDMQPLASQHLAVRAATEAVLLLLVVMRRPTLFENQPIKGDERSWGL